MKKQPEWTMPDTNKLIANYYTATWKQLCAMFPDRTKLAIYNHALRQGLYGKNKFKYIE